MNLLMIAPLCDSRGKIRYFIGAQVDVSGLVKDCTDLDSLRQLVQQQDDRHHDDRSNIDHYQDGKDDFQDLSEMLNMAELETVRKHGGRMHREYQDDEGESSHNGGPHMPRLVLQEPTIDQQHIYENTNRQSGKLSGIYQNVRYFSVLPFQQLTLNGTVSTYPSLPFLSYIVRLAYSPSPWHPPIPVYG